MEKKLASLLAHAVSYSGATKRIIVDGSVIFKNYLFLRFGILTPSSGEMNQIIQKLKTKLNIFRYIM